MLGDRELSIVMYAPMACWKHTSTKKNTMYFSNVRVSPLMK
ncbi:hypothetical protein PI125_g27223 [Phytophthora idaei]|nr:hypothetical protein PI125_g27223 [Phytophthora idaei]